VGVRACVSVSVSVSLSVSASVYLFLFGIVHGSQAQQFSTSQALFAIFRGAQTQTLIFLRVCMRVCVRVCACM